MGQEEREIQTRIRARLTYFDLFPKFSLSTIFLSLALLPTRVGAARSHLYFSPLFQLPSLPLLPLAHFRLQWAMPCRSCFYQASLKRSMVCNELELPGSLGRAVVFPWFLPFACSLVPFKIILSQPSLCLSLTCFPFLFLPLAACLNWTMATLYRQRVSLPLFSAPSLCQCAFKCLFLCPCALLSAGACLSG